MLGDLHPDTRTLSVTLHLQELHAAARDARVARQACPARDSVTVIAS